MVIGIVIVSIVLILLYVLVTYNNLVKSRNYVKEAFSTMDVYLKQRWDLIPNLVEVVKGYSSHEKNVLEDIAKLRASSYDGMSNDNKINLNTKLEDKIAKIMMISEKYPELKANENFLNLSHNLTKVEEDIANSRKYYNGCVRIYNEKIEMFPSVIIANLFGFQSAKMFEIDAEEKNNVKIDL